MLPLGSCEPALVITALSLLLTALGLSVVAGLRAYVPLLVIAAGPFVPNGCGSHLLTLSHPFQNLTGQQTPWIVVVVLAALALGEFVVDKVPGLVHVSDAFHTIVRPLAGAVVMMGLSNPLSEWSPIGAAVVGAALAVSVHAVKTGVRLPISIASGGLLNPVVSVVEDVVVMAVTAVSLAAPILIVVVLALAVLLIFLLGRFAIRRLRHHAARKLSAHWTSPSIPGSVVGWRSSDSRHYSPLHGCAANPDAKCLMRWQPNAS